MKKDAFILYASYQESIEDLTMEQRGKLLTAIFEYQNGVCPEIDDVLVKTIFPFIRRQMDADIEAWDKMGGDNNEYYF